MTIWWLFDQGATTFTIFCWLQLSISNLWMALSSHKFVLWKKLECSHDLIFLLYHTENCGKIFNILYWFWHTFFSIEVWLKMLDMSGDFVPKTFTSSILEAMIRVKGLSRIESLILVTVISIKFFMWFTWLVADM